MAVILRDSLSIFSRITDMEQALLIKLDQYCVNYINAAALFLSVTVSVWTLWYIVPEHAEKLFDKFKTDLGLNTMHHDLTTSLGSMREIPRLRKHCSKLSGMNMWPRFGSKNKTHTMTPIVKPSLIPSLIQRNFVTVAFLKTC